MMNEELANLFRATNLQGIPPFEEQFQFYFDETNNIGNFQLKADKPSRVNDERALTSDFVLGGICFKSPPDTLSLIQELHLRVDIRELKSKYLFQSKSPDVADAFLDDIGQRRVTAILNWLTSHEDVYVHFAVENNLYYAIADIVDSLQGDANFGRKYNLILKDALYRMCKQSLKYILPVLIKHEYPNIKRGFTARFCNDLVKAIEKAATPSDGYSVQVLTMLKAHAESSELVFLHDNEPFMLSEEYWMLYQHRCADFLHSNLIFDRCDAVQNKFIANTHLSNYSFTDSKSSVYIQISDCVVALYARLFRFIDELNQSHMAKMLGEEYLDDEAINALREDKGLPPLPNTKRSGTPVDTRQGIKNISALWKLMERSQKLSPILIMKINPESVSISREEKLRIIAMVTDVLAGS